MEALEKDVSRGLAAVQGEVKALRGEHAQEMRQVERRLAQVEAGGGSGRGVGGVRRSGKPKRRPSLRREYPELVTLEPAEDDEEVFGGAWPLIVERRGLKDTQRRKVQGSGKPTIRPEIQEGVLMPRTNWADMARYKVVLPTLEVSKAFTGLVESCVNRIVSAIHESHTLAAQRDALLPGLVSGEVGVGDTEEFGIKRD